MTGMISRRAGLTCPNCSAVQPYLAASLTYSIWPRALVNRAVHCPSCAGALRMVRRVPFWKIMVVYVCAGLVMLSLFFGGWIALLSLARDSGIAAVLVATFGWVLLCQALFFWIWTGCFSRFFHMVTT